MDDKQGSSSLRRYHLLAREQTDEPATNRSIPPQMLPIAIDASCASASLPHKRRRSSITTEPSLSTFLPSSGERDFLYERHPTLTTTRETRKRSAQDDIVTYASHHFLREHEQYTHKRARYESPNSIELENQPPRATLKRRSLVFQQQQQQQAHQPDLLPAGWDHHRGASDMPLLFNHLLPSLPRLTTTTTPYHRTNSAPTHEHSLADHYSTLLTEHHHHHHHHHSSIFHSNTLGASSQKSTMPKPSNGSSPLRTTNFLLDNKQPTIIRTGNISPAHSDSSSESTSTCSSDEQLHHHHYHMHQPQPWRSFRERENYEQLLDLAEKLSDPNRFNQVDVQQFFSYRYKAAAPTSKQTACVICMSHFKNGQHIRVLPCQHEYHSKCIARWFTMNSSCPICRRDNFLSACS